MHYKEPKNRMEVELFFSLDKSISKYNAVRLIDLIVDKIVLSNPDKFHWKGQSNTGCKSYSPSSMMKLLLYGYFVRISGSRRLETESYRNMELIWLLGDLHPDHWTICKYRSENSEQIKFLAKEFRTFLKTKDYIDGRTIAIDGGKFKANAARDMLSIPSIERSLEKVTSKLDEYLEEFQKIDILSELKEEILNTDQISVTGDYLLNKITELHEKAEKLERQKLIIEQSGKKRLALNDKDANLMKSRDGKLAGYNAQIGVDKKTGMVVFGEISTNENDINLLKTGVEHTKDVLGDSLKEIEADTGYSNMSEIMDIEQNSLVKCYIPSQRNGKKISDKKNGISFTYDETNDCYRCSQGEILTLEQKNKKHQKRIRSVYRGQNCAKCELRSKCTKSPKGRMLYRDIDHKWIEQYKLSMKGKAAKQKIKERKSIVEHVFGSLKTFMGKAHFILCGKKKVQSEFDLYTTVYNLKRLINSDDFENITKNAVEYAW